MTTFPADQDRGPATLARLNAIASAIFARHGIDFASARRAGGWTNAAWLAGGLVLRLAVQPGNDKIRREVRLACLFPPEVGYPPVIETGVTDGYEWSLSREIPGKNLGEVWSGLNWDQRDTALRQLWQRTRMVHSVDPAAAEDWALQRPWFNASDADAAGSAIDRLMRHGFFTPGQAAVLNAGLDRFWQALPSARTVLNHGDLTLDNALWNHGQVVALLDFEYAVIAPVELDLNELVKIAFAPAEQPESISDPDRAGSQRLRDTVAEMSIPLLDHPGGSDLLLGYAILLELWLFNDWLAHPEGEGPVETWQPYRRLLSLADGWGGYLESLLS